MADNGIGASVPRTEDQRFLTGTGDYTDGHRPPPPDIRGLRAVDPLPCHLHPGHFRASGAPGVWRS